MKEYTVREISEQFASLTGYEGRAKLQNVSDFYGSLIRATLLGFRRERGESTRIVPSPKRKVPSVLLRADLISEILHVVYKKSKLNGGKGPYPSWHENRITTENISKLHLTLLGTELIDSEVTQTHEIVATDVAPRERTMKEMIDLLVNPDDFPTKGAFINAKIYYQNALSNIQVDLGIEKTNKSPKKKVYNNRSAYLYTIDEQTAMFEALHSRASRYEDTPDQKWKDLKMNSERIGAIRDRYSLIKPLSRE